MADPITPETKLLCARREASMRRRVYPRWVASGQMTPEQAEREIAIMDAIADDYAQKDLFDA